MNAFAKQFLAWSEASQRRPCKDWRVLSQVMDLQTHQSYEVNKSLSARFVSFAGL